MKLIGWFKPQRATWEVAVLLLNCICECSDFTTVCTFQTTKLFDGSKNHCCDCFFDFSVLQSAFINLIGAIVIQRQLIQSGFVKL